MIFTDGLRNLRGWLLLFGLTAGYLSGAREVMFTTLGIEQGLSHPSVHSIFQDETGVMWFGTRQGLNRYDGEMIIPVAITPRPLEMVDNTVWTITGNHQGSLYLLANKSILHYNLRKQTFDLLITDKVDQFLYLDGIIWYAAGNQLFQMDPGSEESRLVSTFDPQFAPVKQIIRNRQGAFWLATMAGLLKISSEGRVEKRFFEGIQVTTIMEDSNSMLWVGTRKNGAFLLNPHNETISAADHRFLDNEVRCFAEDENGEIWMGTFYGLFLYNKNSGIRAQYLPVDKMPYTLSHSSVYVLYEDKQRNLWVGTYFGGVNYFNPGKDIFKLYTPSTYLPDHLSFPIIGNMTEDSKGQLWICTEGGGLNKLDRETGKITVYRHTANPASIGHNNLKTIWYDKADDRLFVGTHLGGLSVLDLKQNTFTNFTHEPGNDQSLPDNIVYGLVPFEGELLLLTQKGIASFNLNSGRIASSFAKLKGLDSIPQITVMNIHIDHQKRLWLAYSTSELIRIDLVSREVRVFNSPEELDGSILPSRVSHVTEDSKGDLWFATDGYGILRYNEARDSFYYYTAANSGLLSNYCFKIGEASGGDLIITSNKGITFFNPDRGKVRNLSLGSNFPLSGLLEENGIYVASDGEIFIGGYNGMVSFRQEELEMIKTGYHLFFTSLQVNSEPVVPGDASGILTDALPWVDELHLKHHQTHLAISFASSNYIRHWNPEYEYKLEGFDDRWQNARGRSITYTSLPPGKYTLQVRERHSADTGTAVTAQLLIRVSPAWYSSRLAYFLYILTALALITAFVIFDRNRTRLRSSLEFERREKARIEELNQSKLRFFTNISHEFRTPLTLIISQIEMLTRNPGLSQQALTLVMKIQKHALRMRHLVNELLDFNKQEQGHLQLRVSKKDLVAFLNDIHFSFSDYAQARNIGFVFENPGEPLWVWFDPNQMQKVFYNLLSNAFKFTQPGGIVKVRVIPKAQSVVVKLYDTGKGIPVHELNLIFDRFYQAENYTSDSHFIMSSGIGLALSKGIVELHGGTIGVESTEGEGSIFRVELPLGDDHFTSGQKSESEAALLNEAAGLILPEKEFMDMLEVQTGSNGEKPTILLVEDNEDILQLLEELFSPIYTVYKASDGEEGYARTAELRPDIVISDVMMARMSGRELCRKIKSRVDLSHIPVVLLTSLTSPEQISEGFIHGADDYITKPFDAKVLIVRCNNLVNSRRLLRERFSNMLVRPETPEAPGAATAADQELMKKVNQIIEHHLDDPEFNIDLLARETGLGRSKLYARLKDVSGMTPNTYLLNRKMQKAVDWLDHAPQLTISEVAFKLGFNSARYFTLCFKDHYGLSPNEYRRHKADRAPEDQDPKG